MKTTICGVLTIIVTLANAGLEFINTGSVNLPILLTGLTAGYGFIKAADAK